MSLLHDKTMPRPDQVRAEFDHLAALPESWDANTHYHRFLLRHMPPGCDHALEVGCGTGKLACALATRAKRVTAIDLSPEMISRARRRAAAHGNIELIVADAAAWDFPPRAYDFVISVATLHHLPLGRSLDALREATAPGGVLAILDLLERPGMTGVLHNAVAAPMAAVLRFVHTGRLLPPPLMRRAWREHGRGDRYLTPAELQEAVRTHLPGALVRRHLLWRYSVIWRRAD